MRYEILGGADDATTAAILAAVARLDEERDVAAGHPQSAPRQSLWVLSSRPRPVQGPFVTEDPATASSWSVGGDENGTVSES